jgi:hypothetical protein
MMHHLESAQHAQSGRQPHARRAPLSSRELGRLCVFRTSIEKMNFTASQLNAWLDDGALVIDVGCREKYLEHLLKPGLRYVGADVAGSPGVFIDLEIGLPFQDQSCDAVLALDVLEHVEHIHAAARELCRVSRDWVIIALPNMYEYLHRTFVAAGKMRNGKYGLPLEPPGDRHRWFFSYDDAQAFCRHIAGSEGFRVEVDFPHYPAWRRFPLQQLNWVARSLSLRPNLFARSYWCVLRRNR